MGRQPWVVYGLLKTAKGVSPIGTGYVVTTLVGFTAIYTLLAIIDFGLMARYAKLDPDGVDEHGRHRADDEGRRRRGRRRPTTTTTGSRPSSTERQGDCTMITIATAAPAYTGLEIFWFLVIAVLWVGYFALEGFDFGVGMLLPVVGKSDLDRRVMINTIGPVWDGNEVWLLVAGGATFAAFPNWYATLFSGFYLPLFLILAALIFRGVAFEYRSKRDDAAVAPGLGPRHLLGQPGPVAAVGRGLRQHPAGHADRTRTRPTSGRSSTC